MVSAAQCMTYAKECQQLGMAADISLQRATVLMRMAYSWDELADHTERYDAIVKAETK